MSAENHFAESGRAAKVAKITAFIDAELKAHRMSPHSVDVLDRLLVRLVGMSAKDWASLCKKHDVRAPSDKTVAAVVEKYRERLETVRAARRVA